MPQNTLALPQFKLQRERRFSHVLFCFFLSSASNRGLQAVSLPLLSGGSDSKESTCSEGDPGSIRVKKIP